MTSASAGVVGRRRAEATKRLTNPCEVPAVPNHPRTVLIKPTTTATLLDDYCVQHMADRSDRDSLSVLNVVTRALYDGARRSESCERGLVGTPTTAAARLAVTPV